MRAHAEYKDATAGQRRIMDAFIERSLRENTEMLASARHHHVPIVDIANPEAFDGLVNELTARAVASPA
ncbi:hypothetical protein G6L82_003270 [Agrobacterium tumefaciens]|nr:hypothetical protein [Agrobacterium sp. 13-2099-1-2]UZX42326.1 hypothetical protein A6U84_03170 [Agrobacterium sp. 13-2099-1-2]WIE33089.1 hypothetical protein G6L82_003270 [Agrobacterium tumefaciens]